MVFRDLPQTKPDIGLQRINGHAFLEMWDAVRVVLLGVEMVAPVALRPMAAPLGQLPRLLVARDVIRGIACTNDPVKNAHFRVPPAHLKDTGV